MNSLQRRKLKRKIRNTICPNCGEKGPHFLEAPPFSWRLDQKVSGGFWTCPKYYGPDGRRLPEHIEGEERFDKDISTHQIMKDVFSLIRQYKAATRP